MNGNAVMKGELIARRIKAQKAPYRGDYRMLCGGLTCGDG